MRRAVVALLIAALANAAAPPLRAGGLSDYVLAPGAFAADAAAAAPAWPLSYRHERHDPGEQAALEETLSLAPGERGGVSRLVLSRAPADRPAQEVTNFSPDAANPVVLYFLEATTRNMATATGGSPFYIRNRIREALGAADLGTAAEADHGGTAVEVQRTTLRPFDGDPNRGRMGEFADLALTITVAPGLPGRILELSADTAAPGSGYHERLTLIPEVE